MTTAAVVTAAVVLIVGTAPGRPRRPLTVRSAAPAPGRSGHRSPIRRLDGIRHRLRRLSAETTLPPALDELARSLRSGASLGEALTETARPRSDTAIGHPVLEPVADAVSSGSSAIEALERWRSSEVDDAVHLTATALAVGIESGGSHSEAVESVAATLRERAEVEREAQALATQARASAAVIAVAPVGFTLLIVGVDRSALAFLVGTRTGWACIVGGLVLDGVGLAWMLRILDRPGALPASPPTEQTETAGRIRLAAATVALLAAFVILGPVGAAVGAGIGVVRHRRRATRSARRHADGLINELPDLIDLIALALGAGASVAQAVAAAARPRSPVSTGALADGLSGAMGRAALGTPLADALEQVPESVGPTCRPLVDALVAAERHGAPLLPTITILGRDARLQRRRRTEERARTVSVRLLFPLVTCVLPAFALLTVVPLLAGSISALTG